jgi:chemotaxis protein histidine kinase CheA/ActR/RegA family two-component response regulator
MMNDPSSRDQSYDYFLTEAPELLQTIEQELLTLAEDRSSDKIYTLMRATHTLKGMVASLGMHAIEDVTHSLESVFNALFEPSVVIDADLEALLFQAYESLCLLLAARWTPIEIDETSVSAQAKTIFAQLRERLGNFFTRSKHLPTSKELDVDITQSIFETVVQEGLTAIRESLNQPSPEVVATTLREKATMFLGLAEGLDLPGFVDIAQATIAALEAKPTDAIAIAHLALADFQQGQSLILSGNRTQGGVPSVPLQTLANSSSLVNTARTISASPSEPESIQLAVQAKASPPTTTSTAQTIRVNLERLKHLKYLMGSLLTNQTRQDSAKEQLQDTLHKFRHNFQQHQQTLNAMRESLSQGRTSLQVSANSASGATLNPLMQSALEESAQLEAVLGEITSVQQQLTQAIEQQQQLVLHIQDDLTDAQAAPLGEILNRLLPVVQRLVTTYNKPAELTLEGTEIVVDKAIAEKLYIPLLHLVRNAFDHGLESGDVRQRQGKPAVGQIYVRAEQQDQQIVIEVEDDGRGLDFTQIRRRAAQMAFLSSIEAEKLSDTQLQDLLFEPRFSTTSNVNELSGHGIGLNVVRSQVQALQGSISVQSIVQQGTTFTLQIPILSTLPELTTIDTGPLLEPSPPPVTVSPPPSLNEIWGQDLLLKKSSVQSSVVQPSHETWHADSLITLIQRSFKATESLIWMANSVIFVLSYRQIEEYLAPKTYETIQSRSQRFLHWRDQMVRVYSLSELLSDSGMPSPTEQQSQQTKIMLVVRLGQRIVALESELKRLMTTPEILIQANDARPGSCVCGYTRLTEGESVPVVDVTALLDQTLMRSLTPLNQAVEAPSKMPPRALPLVNSTPHNPINAAPTPPSSRKITPSATEISTNVLVVDDSPAMRKLLGLSLEEAGYRVIEAQDGQDAIDQLQKARVHLIICDMDMPRLNGFGFLKQYFREPSIAKVPVVMLSNWDSHEYRKRALALGATDYFVKPYDKSKLVAALRSISPTVRAD